MRDILISIKPEWCEKILSGEKKSEIRKTRPKITGPEQTVYIYQTGNGGVIGSFHIGGFSYIQAWIDEEGEKHLGNALLWAMDCCLTNDELFNYIHREQKPEKPYPGGWAWFVKNPIRFKKPLHLSTFGMKRPPQSWCYVDAIQKKKK